jgi:hypothetical protein
MLCSLQELYGECSLDLASQPRFAGGSNQMLAKRSLSVQVLACLQIELSPRENSGWARSIGPIP